mmetsp:Transcript_30710/g.94868  ORF Transcript_30710/g.94868 Transcript_30710/m.94868 type:complete len:667 (-) Transcript_30710:18-2018(-)
MPSSARWRDSRHSTWHGTKEPTRTRTLVGVVVVDLHATLDVLAQLRALRLERLKILLLLLLLLLDRLEELVRRLRQRRLVHVALVALARAVLRRALRLLALLRLGLGLGLEVLVARRLVLEHLADGGALGRRRRVQRRRHLEQGRRAVDGADGDVVALRGGLHRVQGVVGDLHGEHGRRLARHEVPDVHVAVHARRKEDARALRVPAAVREVGLVVVRRVHAAALEVLAPQPRRPVAHGEEVLGVHRVALHAVHGAVVAVEGVAADLVLLLALAVAGEDGALLGADHELGGTTDGGVVVDARAAEDAGGAALVLGGLEHERLRVELLDDDGVDGLVGLPAVPDERLAVGGDGEDLTALRLEPLDVPHGVLVRLLDVRLPDGALRRARVPVLHDAVVGATGDEVGVLAVVLDAAQRRVRRERLARRVRVRHVPDVRRRRAALVGRLTLEAQVAVRHGELLAVAEPRHTHGGALHRARVLEHGDGLHRRRAERRVGGLVGEVAAVDVDGVVLLEVLLHAAVDEVLHGAVVLLVALRLLAVLALLLELGRVDANRPTALVVRLPLVLQADAVGVRLRLGERRDVGDLGLVRVDALVHRLELRVGRHVGELLRVARLELHLAAELLHLTAVRVGHLGHGRWVCGGGKAGFVYRSVPGTGLWLKAGVRRFQ